MVCLHRHKHSHCDLTSKGGELRSQKIKHTMFGMVEIRIFG